MWQRNPQHVCRGCLHPLSAACVYSFSFHLRTPKAVKSLCTRPSLFPLPRSRGQRKENYILKRRSNLLVRQSVCFFFLESATSFNTDGIVLWGMWVTHSQTAQMRERITFNVQCTRRQQLYTEISHYFLMTSTCAI